MISIILMSGLALLLNLPVSAQTNSSENTDIQKKSLKEIVKQLENTYSVSITIDGDLEKSEIDINEASLSQIKSIETALKLITKNNQIEYVKMRDDYYVIGKKESKGSTFIKVEDKKTNKKQITGQVLFNEDSSPIPGATILVKGTTNGVISDFDGNFTIDVKPEDKFLEVSFLGMKSVDLDISEISNFTVKMDDDAFGLDEVIVSGVAANTPKKLLSVSVTKVNADVLQEAHAASAASTLQGKVAGVTVVHANGQPGSGASIRLRGSTSLSGANAPLIIMDGIQISTNLADINIDDIESMEVVKGAAASALYGSKAGNGVIVVTTKRGNRNKKGVTTVNIRQEIGSQEIPKYIEQATHHPYKLADDNNEFPYTKYSGVIYDTLGNPLYGSRHLTESGYADQDYAVLNEHQKDFYQKGFYNSTYVSVMGNSAKTNFSLSYEYNKQEGVLFSTNGYSRNNFRINLDHNITDYLKVSTSNMIVMTKDNNPGSTRSFSDLLFVSPDVDLTAPNEDGTPYRILPDPWSVGENPLYPLVNRHKESKRRSLIGNVKLIYSPFDWLSINGKYTYEYRNKYWSTYTPLGYLGFSGAYEGGSLYKRNYNNLNQYTQFTINLNKQFGDFTTKVKLSYLYENIQRDNFSAFAQNFLVPDIPQFPNTDQESAQLISYDKPEVAIDYFGILDMDYKDKIIFSALYRMDASSLFGENERWNPYYRFSLAYRITEDVHIPGIQELKIRASQGTSGQRPIWNGHDETLVFENGNLVTYNLGNKNLRPSETTETELGLDMNFLNAFSFTFTYSNSLTRGAFGWAKTPSQTGFPYQYRNIGHLKSEVFEASLGIDMISRNNFSWSSNLNFDRVRQTVIKLDVPNYTNGPRNAFSIRVGETFGVMYGYTWLRSLEEMKNQLPSGASIENYEINNEGYVILAGTQGTLDEKPIKLDANNDGLGDKVQIGDGNPDFQLNWGNTFSFKGISLYMLWSWKNGGDVYNYTRQYTFRDQRDLVFDQTNVAESDKKTVNYYAAFYDGTGINDYFIEDGTYLKLREVSIYYSLKGNSLPNFLVKYIKSFRIGFQARNLLTITNYKGYDPEVASGSDLTNFPFDNFGYPNYRTYTGSISINF